MAQYYLSSDAAEDIERLFLSLGIELFGAQQATKYIDGLEKRLEHIANSPVVYPDVAHIRSGYRRSVYGVHSIYFREIDGHSVEIVRIIGREGLQKI